MMSVTSVPGRRTAARSMSTAPGVVGQLAGDVVERAVLEDQHRVGVVAAPVQSMPRASSRVAGATIRRPGMCAYQPSRLCECCAASWRPAPVVIRITSGHVELAAGHVQQGGGVVQDLVEREQAEVDRHDLDDRPHPAERGADAGADERRLRQRRVADPLRAELLQQAEADREAAAVAADVLAHEEDPLVARAAPRGSPSRIASR